MFKQIIHKIRQMRSDIHEKRRHQHIFTRNQELAHTYAIFKNSPEGEWIIGKNDESNLY